MMTPAIWTAMYVENSTPAALRKLHACGWRSFELSTEHLQKIDEDADRQARIDEVKQTLADLGATMPQAHAHLAANVAQPDAARRAADIVLLERHLRCCAELGVRNVVIHPGGGAGYTTGEQLRQIVNLNVEAFTRLGDLAGQLGLRIGLENLMDGGGTGRRCFGSSPHEILDLLAKIGNPALGITIDTSHANVQKLDVPETIRQFGAHLCCTHISDNDGSGDQHRIPGIGKIDWLGVMQAFRDIGYEGIFNLEIPGERHPVPDIVAMKMRHAREVTGWLVEKTQ